jgi:hypothetical protein
MGNSAIEARIPTKGMIQNALKLVSGCVTSDPMIENGKTGLAEKAEAQVRAAST